MQVPFPCQLCTLRMKILQKNIRSRSSEYLNFCVYGADQFDSPWKAQQRSFCFQNVIGCPGDRARGTSLTLANIDLYTVCEKREEETEFKLLQHKIEKLERCGTLHTHLRIDHSQESGVKSVLSME